ncbi:MAG: methionyl-tRNA formyltransferase [bacterium]
MSEIKNELNRKPTYAFFGSAEMSVYVLDEMEKAGFKPSLIITTPDKPKGRNLALSPTPVKVWGNAYSIPVLDPIKLDDNFVDDFNKKNAALPGGPVDLFIVAAYGKIIPQTVLDLAPHKTLNIHPSLLPQYRGAAPLQSAILDDRKETGITVMRIDALMDHGPVVAQKRVTIDEWPTYEVFEENMARDGARLLAGIMADWVSGKIKEREQDHTQATFTRKFVKEDGIIDINKITTGTTAEQYDAFRKIQAFHLWPTTYFFADKKSGNENITRKIRVKITGATWDRDHLTILKVVPEGKNETDFALFMRNL